jgi:ketosteroid isomerase-like protein
MPLPLVLILLARFSQAPTEAAPASNAGQAPARVTQGTVDVNGDSSGAAGSLPGDSKDGELKKVVAALRDAGLRRDVGALERLYAPNYYHINPDGSTMEREQVLDSYRRKAPMTFTSVEADEWRSILRSSFAVVSERTSLHGRTADGQPFISRYRVTYLLERRNGSWQVLNSHASLLGIDKNPATP